MPKRQEMEKVNFDAALGSRALGTVAAKRAKYNNLSDFLRQALYELIEQKIPNQAERKTILELLNPDLAESTDDTERKLTDEDIDRYPQARPLSPEAEQRIRDRIHARGGKVHDEDAKTGTDG